MLLVAASGEPILGEKTQRDFRPEFRRLYNDVRRNMVAPAKNVDATFLPPVGRCHVQPGNDLHRLCFGNGFGMS